MVQESCRCCKLLIFFFDMTVKQIFDSCFALGLQGNAIGQSGLGLMYMFGKGVEKVTNLKC